MASAAASASRTEQEKHSESVNQSRSRLQSKSKAKKGCKQQTRGQRLTVTGRRPRLLRAGQIAKEKVARRRSPALFPEGGSTTKHQKGKNKERKYREKKKGRHGAFAFNISFRFRNPFRSNNLLTFVSALSSVELVRPSIRHPVHSQRRQLQTADSNTHQTATSTVAKRKHSVTVNTKSGLHGLRQNGQRVLPSSGAVASHRRGHQSPHCTLRLITTQHQTHGLSKSDRKTTAAPQTTLLNHLQIFQQKLYRVSTRKSLQIP